MTPARLFLSVLGLVTAISLVGAPDVAQAQVDLAPALTLSETAPDSSVDIDYGDALEAERSVATALYTAGFTLMGAGGAFFVAGVAQQGWGGLGFAALGLVIAGAGVLHLPFAIALNVDAVSKADSLRAGHAERATINVGFSPGGLQLSGTF